MSESMKQECQYVISLEEEYGILSTEESDIYALINSLPEDISNKFMYSSRIMFIYVVLYLWYHNEGANWASYMFKLNVNISAFWGYKPIVTLWRQLGLDKQSTDFVSINGILIKYIGKSKDINIPSNITCIGKHAFEKLPIESIAIGSSVDIIDKWSFERCTKLKQVDIEEGLKRIHRYAFYGCKALEYISIPSSVEYIDKQAFDEQYMKSVILNNENTIYLNTQINVIHN